MDKNLLDDLGPSVIALGYNLVIPLGHFEYVGVFNTLKWPQGADILKNSQICFFK